MTRFIGKIVTGVKQYARLQVSVPTLAAYIGVSTEKSNTQMSFRAGGWTNADEYLVPHDVVTITVHITDCSASSNLIPS